jgi:hypothetical protein
MCWVPKGRKPTWGRPAASCNFKETLDDLFTVFLDCGVTFADVLVGAISGQRLDSKTKKFVTLKRSPRVAGAVGAFLTGKT